VWRIRILRFLVPALLVPFLVLLVLEFRPRRGRPEPVAPDADEPRVVAHGVEVLSLEGARRLWDLRVRAYREPTAGGQVVEGVERLDLFRDDAAPLLVTADLAEIRGEAPSRVAIIEGGLHVRDDDAGMELDLPVLEVDEAAREARSRGAVRFRAPGYDGSAEEVVYPLDDRPTRFRGLDIRSEGGSRLQAATARLLRESDEIELSDEVSLQSGATVVRSPWMVVRRNAEGGWVDGVEASLGIEGRDDTPSMPPAMFRAHRLEAAWSTPGRLRHVALIENAMLRRGARGLAAARIDAARPDAIGEEWDVRADGGVIASDVIRGSTATLRAEGIRARLSDRLEVLSGTAAGDVRFEHADVLATADRAVLAGPAGSGEITLTGENDRKARIAQADRRVAGDVIRTRPGTRWLRAEGRAEATLLPREGGNDSPGTAVGGLFRAGDAVHLVARTLESGTSGEELVLEEGVRAWQGERNLSAERVVLDQASSSLRASGGVTTRLPLEEGRAAVQQADHVQVSAATLDYDDGQRRAVYRGGVRVRQDLGWLECDSLEVTLAPSGGIDRMLGTGRVGFEYRSRDAAGMPKPVRGTGDRIEYDPRTQVVLVYGDERPATVRTEANGGGSSEGRVIRYGLVDGSLEVDGAARVRTGAGAEGS